MEAKLLGAEHECEHEHGQRYETVTQMHSFIKMENGRDKVTEMVSLIRRNLTSDISLGKYFRSKLYYRGLRPTDLPGPEGNNRRDLA